MNPEDGAYNIPNKKLYVFTHIIGNMHIMQITLGAITDKRMNSSEKQTSGEFQPVL